MQERSCARPRNVATHPAADILTLSDWLFDASHVLVVFVVPVVAAIRFGSENEGSPVRI
jgi:hypothetical protein